MRKRVYKTWSGSCEYDGKIYSVHMTFRRKSGVAYRLSSKKKDTILVSAPTFCASHPESILKQMDKSLGRLIERSKKWVGNKKGNYFSDGYLYVLGEREYHPEFDEKAAKEYLTKIGVAFYQERVPYWRKKMGISMSITVKIRDMKTRFGSMTWTKGIVRFATTLIAYPPEVVDSVIVHELAHIFEPNHQKRFYSIVRRYIPNYDEHRKKLIRYEYGR